MKAREKGFTQGVAWAVALLARTGPMHADQVWTESGFNENDLSVCDPQDAHIIREMIRDKEES